MHEELSEEVSNSNVDAEMFEDVDNFFGDDENINEYENNDITMAISIISSTK